jgi:hypothetical protein
VFAGLKVFAPIFFAFGLILMIGAPMSQLLLARGVARQREIGVRLSLARHAGVSSVNCSRKSRPRAGAAAGGFVVSRLFLEGGLHLASPRCRRNWPNAAFGASADWASWYSSRGRRHLRLSLVSCCADHALGPRANNEGD